MGENGSVGPRGGGRRPGGTVGYGGAADGGSSVGGAAESWTAARVGLDDLDFTRPVRGLTFDAIEADDCDQVALARVHGAGGLLGEVPVLSRILTGGGVLAAWSPG